MNHNDVSNPVTRSELHEATSRMDWLLGGVILVLLVGFVTMFATVGGLILDAQRFKTETYQDLVNKVNDTNTKLDTVCRILKCK